MREYTEKDEKGFEAVLNEIQNRIPKFYLDMVVETVDFTPTIKMVFEKALLSPDISAEKKVHVKDMLDSGKLSRKVYRENPKYAKMIDGFVNREINKAIREGRLPPKSHIKNFPSQKHAQKKKKS